LLLGQATVSSQQYPGVPAIRWRSCRIGFWHRRVRLVDACGREVDSFWEAKTVGFRRGTSWERKPSDLICKFSFVLPGESLETESQTSDVVQGRLAVELHAEFRPAACNMVYIRVHIPQISTIRLGVQDV
jgi:hypothetical protein